jgi:hypothetical protein
MSRIFVKPAPQPQQPKGEPPLPPRKVRKPVNGHLKAEGEWVYPESYWLRRIKDGDVVQDMDAIEPADPVAATASADATSKTRKS